jgi:hypothetical protein
MNVVSGKTHESRDTRVVPRATNCALSAGQTLGAAAVAAGEERKVAE